MSSRQPRVAVVLSHPVQYYSPWFDFLTRSARVKLRVFYLWDPGRGARHDPGFGTDVSWDVPLLDGHEWEAVPNVSPNPGTERFLGLDNPDLPDRLLAWAPDAILCFGYAYLSQLRLFFSPKLRGVPVLFRGDSHELAPRGGWRADLSRAARRLLFRRFSAGLAVGKANTAYLLDSGMNSDRVFFAPHAVDNNRFRSNHDNTQRHAREFRQSLGVSEDRRLLLFVGKFEEKKQPLQLLDAWAHSGASAHASLVFVGEGALGADLRRNVTAFGLEQTVRFAGFVNQSRMPGVYAASDALVLPSRGSGETWGLCVNEGMNLGLPALVSSHVGCGPDLVEEGRTGWTFPAGNVEALSNRIGVFGSMPMEQLNAMAHNCLERISQYSYREASEGLFRALESIDVARH